MRSDFNICIEPGDRFGHLTVVNRDMVDGLWGGLSMGWWIAQCDCGAYVRVHTRDLRRGSRRAYACPSCPGPPPKPRSGRSDKGKRRGPNKRTADRAKG